MTDYGNVKILAVDDVEDNLDLIRDVFDTLVSDRPYRQAVSHSTALAELHRCKEILFDPTAVDAFAVVIQRK